MIVGSLLLILVAVVLLVLGLMDGSSPLLVSSIGASVLAAVVLIVGIRQSAPDRVDEEYLDEPAGGRVDGDEDDLTTEVPALVGARYAAGGVRPPDQDDVGGLIAVGVPGGGPGQTASSGASEPYTFDPPVGWDEPEPAAAPVARPAVGDGGPGVVADLADGEADDEDPADEPAAQVVAAADLTRVAKLSVDVLVIDGRPRFHLPGCVHLLGRESEPLAVGEAVELGFTSCSLCEAASVLLTDSLAG